MELEQQHGDLPVSQYVHSQPSVVYYDQRRYDEKFGYAPAERSVGRSAAEGLRRNCACTPRWLLDRLLSFVPFLLWLPKYNLRKNVLGDFVAGLTVGIVHLPQGMAYASLAGLRPVNGIYTSYFGQLFYMLFGTSRHVSLGVFAVVSLMTGAVRYRVVPMSEKDFEELQAEAARLHRPLTVNRTDIVWDPTPEEAVTALTFTVGLVLVLMGVFHLEMLTAFLSDQVVQGFTTGASCHVVSAQVNKILGISLPRYNGFLRLFYSGNGVQMWRDFVYALPDANHVAVLLAIGTWIWLLVGKELVNPRLRKVSRVPIPWEFLIVILFTAVGYFGDFKAKYHVHQVDEIPTGIPTPRLPRFDLMIDMFGDAVGVAVTLFVIELSLAKMFAKKFQYKVDVGQELYALGFMEIGCSLFKCWPAAASVSRTLVYANAGLKTQLATVFSVALLSGVLLFVGPLFKTLPFPVLGAIICFALKGAFMQFQELPSLWRLSKTDFAIWVFAFLAPVILDVREGLAATIAFTLLTVVFRTQKPRYTAVGRLGNSDHYESLELYNEAHPIEGVCIFQWEFALIFTNAELFKESLYEKFGIDITAAKKRAKKLRKRRLRDQEKLKDVDIVAVLPNDRNGAVEENSVTYLREGQERNLFGYTCKRVERGLMSEGRLEGYPECIVINCATISQIDVMGLEALKTAYAELKEIGVDCFFAGCNPHVRALFDQDKKWHRESVPNDVFYPTLVDCLHYRAQRLQQNIAKPAADEHQ